MTTIFVFLMHLGYVIGWQNRNFCCEGKKKSSKFYNNTASLPKACRNVLVYDETKAEVFSHYSKEDLVQKQHIIKRKTWGWWHHTLGCFYSFGTLDINKMGVSKFQSIFSKHLQVTARRSKKIRGISPFSSTTYIQVNKIMAPPEERQGFGKAQP